jgi:hypothetical protein
MMLLACGDAAPAADAGLADGAVGDGAADDAAVDAALAGVTVTAVGDDGRPETGTVVLVHDADGALLGRYATNAAGQAVVDAPGGGMVSAVQYGSGRAVTTTVLGVQPLDELHFQAPPRVPVRTTQIQVLARPITGATRFRAFSSCGGSDDDVASILWISPVSACLEGLARFVVVASGADGVLGHVHTVVDDGRTIVGFADDYAPLAELVLDVRGSSAIGSAAPIVPAGHEALLPVPTFLAAGLNTVPLAGDGAGLSLTVSSSDGSIAQRFATTPTAPVVMALDAIPAVDDLRLRFDTRTFAWGVNGGAAADGLVLQIVAADGPRTTWRFVTPPDRRGLALPALPDDLAHLSPFAAEGALGAEVASIDLSWVSGWDAFRQRGHLDAAQLPAIVAARLEDSRAVVGRSSGVAVEE